MFKKSKNYCRPKNVVRGNRRIDRRVHEYCNLASHLWVLLDFNKSRLKCCNSLCRHFPLGRCERFSIPGKRLEFLKDLRRFKLA